MQPKTDFVDPFALSSIGSVASNNSLSSWLFQPYQQNSSGTLPGTTVINVGQVISIDGHNDYIIISNPSTGIKQIMLGKLLDGTYGLVISKPGIDVTTVFN